MLCHKTFQTQYCFVNGIPIPISLYDPSMNGLCKHGHKLVHVNRMSKPHFRHANIEDTNTSPMTEWHAEWQGNFPYTEQIFPCKEGQIKERRADVYLNESTILEIQHSCLTQKEVEDRDHDYKLHDINILWIIDGNDSVMVHTPNDRVYLEFTKDLWKYQHFTSYSCIYIDIQETIYKIDPSKVKCQRIDVDHGKPKNYFIHCLKENIPWNSEVEQCILYIKQQGAGNGKTYGIIQMLDDLDKQHYKNFIYITKQHSAKHIIKQEFESQRPDILFDTSGKKYVGKRGDINITIQTIDSFTYSIGNTQHTEFDKFEGILHSIIDGHIETSSTGAIKYSKTKLNKETLLVIDEFQDPPEYYAKAIVKLMREKYIDVFIVGDKLQSISNEKNAFTYFLDNEFHEIKKVFLEPTNICRRFSHPRLVDFVNCMIPFSTFALPIITPYRKNEDIDPLYIIKGDSIHVGDKKEKEIRIYREVEKIMILYIREVEENKRVPEDFLIVTPFTNHNPLVEALLLSLRLFWKEKYHEDDYERYAIFHKSEEGTSIDLSESEHSTRIVSGHSSKGDGRPIVFVIGFSENALCKFSKETNNLIYHSLFHVAITRMKEKLYIYHEYNGDDISQKLGSYFKEDILQNSPRLKLKYIIPNSTLIDPSQDFTFLKEHFIQDSLNLEGEGEKRIIDAGHHNIRFSTLKISMLMEILNTENKKKHEHGTLKQQNRAVLHTIDKATIVEVKDMKGYYSFLSENKSNPKKTIPVLKYSDRGRDYKKYFKMILDFMNTIKKKIKTILFEFLPVVFCPLESILLNHMIGIVYKHTETNISINDIYDILDIYSNSFTNVPGHETCLCNHCFSEQSERRNQKIDTMKEYLTGHFDKIQKMKNIIHRLYENYPTINWLMDYDIIYEGSDASLKIKKTFSFVGYTDAKVLLCYIKPQFNELNYHQTMIDTIVDCHLLKQSKHNVLLNKEIVACILTLDQCEPYYIYWGDKLVSYHDEITKLYYKNMMTCYRFHHKFIYAFYKFHKKNCPLSGSLATLDYITSKFKAELDTYEINLPRETFYLYQFLNYIHKDISIQKKATALQAYDQEDFFLDKIDTILHTSLCKFLGIVDRDDF